MPNAPVASLADHVGALVRAGKSVRGLSKLFAMLGRDLWASFRVTLPTGAHGSSAVQLAVGIRAAGSAAERGSGATASESARAWL